MEIAGENPFIEIRVIFLTIAHSRDREYYEMFFQSQRVALVFATISVQPHLAGAWPVFLVYFPLCPIVFFLLTASDRGCLFV
jgi:hypothetical protein